MSWRRFFRRRSLERDRAEELRSHLALYVDELIARGRTRDQAEREARLAFGNPRVALEEVDRMNRLPILDVVGRDLKYAVRVLRRTPAFTLTAIATLALVIGACTAVFSLADAILLRPLPYPNPEALAYLERWTTSSRGQGADISHDGRAWEIVRDRVPSLECAAYGASFGGGVNLAIGGTAARVQQQRVSASYFSVLGVLPARGRAFTPDEDRPGGPQAVILSDALWRGRFGADPSIAGKGVLLRGEPYTVVGVMPASFVNISDVDVWTPLRATQSGEGGGTNFGVIVRVRPGATIQQANAELASLGREPFANLRLSPDVTAGLRLRPMQDALVEGVRQPIVMLSAAVGTVLLIACVNLAALLIARGSGRAREVATRMALGSGRRAVVRQLMAEAVVVALAGGALGLVLGGVMLRALQALGGETFSEWERVSLDWRTLAATLGLAGLTSVIFGLAPALQASRIDVNAVLSSGSTRAVAGGRRRWPRQLLVVTEVALGVVLLVTAGLLVRTFVALQRLDPGFNPRNVTTASVSLLDARYQSGTPISQLFDRSLERIVRAPGVDSAAVALGLPYERLLNYGFRFMDVPDDPGRVTNATYVAGDIFRTLEIPILRGRALAATDADTSAPVAVVNEAFARYYSQDRDAIGRRIRIARSSAQAGDREIVGIAKNVQQRGSGFFLPGMPQGPLTSPPLVYLPASQAADGMRGVHVWFSPVWIVRARSTADAAVAIRDAIASVDPMLPTSDPQPMTAVMARATSEQRLLMTLVLVLAVAALLLSAIGIHGLIAHSVAERRREFGVRIALGATPGQTMRSVALNGVALACIGAIAGGLLSLASVRLVQSFLWNVGERDPLTYVGVALFVLVVSAIASALPAARILRLDPAEVLKA